MDGLPIIEQNTFSYRSKNTGKMHACGHDGHMAMLLGAAQVLSQKKSFPECGSGMAVIASANIEEQLV